MGQFREKSLKLNMVLNAVKGLMGIIFPLISFPYVSRILGVENIGKYNFANSIVSYFILIAALGIVTYSVRDGAKLREDKEKFKHFADEMFTINIISSVVAYILLFVLMLIVPKFHEYTGLLLIFSLQIIFKTIGIDWIYSIYEDYAYITIRSIVFQVLSLVMLFLFVKTEDDLLKYVGVTVFANAGSNIFNYIHSRKYCKVWFTTKIDWKRHLKPIFVLFAMNITITLYASSGTTILGFLSGDYAVGIFSVSAKVYAILKTVLSSVLIVSIPRLSAIYGKKDFSQFNEVSSDIYSTLITLVFPTMVGVILLIEPIVLIISDETFITATSSLFWLSLSLIVWFGAAFWGQCVLVPANQENTVLKATIASALSNIIICLLLVPYLDEDAAAIGTLVAEGIAFIWCIAAGRKYVKLIGVWKTILKVIVGCIPMIVFILVLKMLSLNMWFFTVLSVGGGAGIYFIVEILLKNNAVWGIIKKILKR